MILRWSGGPLAIGVSALLLAACGLLPSTVVLVRDNAGLFSAEARADAEQRLGDLSAEHGILFFILTEEQVDPPRVMDAPMAEARQRGLPAIALMLDRSGVVAEGYSEHDGFGSLAAPSSVDDMIAGGRADEALDL